MGRRKRDSLAKTRRRRTPKNPEVHFRIDPVLLHQFQEAASRQGETIHDAHRRAMDDYVEHAVPKRNAFVMRAHFRLGDHGTFARAIAVGRNEIRLRLSGPLMERLILIGEGLADKGVLSIDVDSPLVTEIIRTIRRGASSGKRIPLVKRAGNGAPRNHSNGGGWF